MSVSAVNQASSNGSSYASTGGGLTGDFQTFLRMLTTQLKNQDPLDPVDSTELTVQLATFSGVEQQTKTNSLLQDLIQQVSLSGMTELAGWVGMQARADAPVYYDGQPVSIQIEPATGADRAVLAVYNAAGTLVAQDEINPVSAEVAWNGQGPNGSTLPSGLYSFKVMNYSDGKLSSISPVETYGTVKEARTEHGKTILVMRGGIEVEADAVTALRTPQS